MSTAPMTRLVQEPKQGSACFKTDLGKQSRNGRRHNVAKGPVTDPRSHRFNHEVDHCWEDWVHRVDVGGTLLAINMQDPVVLPRAFTATEEGRREAAMAATNLDVLVLASDVVGELLQVGDLPPVRPEVIKNAQATMLQELAAWAEKEKRDERRGVMLEQGLERAQRHGLEYFAEKNEEAYHKALEVQKKMKESPAHTQAELQQQFRIGRPKGREAPSLGHKRKRAPTNPPTLHQHNFGPVQHPMAYPFVVHQMAGPIEQRSRDTQVVNSGVRPREIRPAPRSVNQGLDVMYGNQPPLQFQPMPLYHPQAPPPSFYYHPPSQQPYPIPPPPYYGHPSPGAMGPPPIPPPHFIYPGPPQPPHGKM